LQFKSAFRDYAPDLCEVLSIRIPKEFETRISESKQTVYVTRTAMPLLIVGTSIPELARSKPEVLDQYLENVLVLQKAWREIEPEVREISSRWIPQK
jgi:hypothetical protein